jgi:glycosyltransferase involved in cell wall biosynthesis
VWRIKSILTISEFSKSEIVHFLGVAPARITVTHLAASDAFADGANSTLPDDLPSQAEANGYILCVANTYPHKNVHTLITAFGEMAREHPHHLVLVGKARRGEEAVQQAMASLPDAIRGKVHRLQGVAYPELVALYRNCSVFVFPSLYEGFGLPILEAMLAGVPVVASDIPTHREVGGDGVRYADATDSFALANTVNQILAAGKGSLRTAKDDTRQFSWQKAAETTHAAIKREVAAKSG